MFPHFIRSSPFNIRSHPISSYSIYRIPSKSFLASTLVSLGSITTQPTPPQPAHPLSRLYLASFIISGMLLDLATTAPVLFVLLLARSWDSLRAVSILRVLRVLRTFTFASELTLQPVTKQASRRAVQSRMKGRYHAARGKRFGSIDQCKIADSRI